MGLLAIFKDALGIKSESNLRVGLSSFNLGGKNEETMTRPEISIRNKNVTLSDLMIRSNSY